MATVPFTSARRYPLPTDIAKRLPHNPDAERAVLGAILMENQALKVISSTISADDFFLPQNRLVFQYMAKLAAAEQAIDLVTLTDELSREKYLDAAGGAGYVTSLVDGMPKVSNVKYYADIVARDSRRRRTVYGAYRVEQMAHDENIPLEDVEREFELVLKQAKLGTVENPAVVVGFQKLLTMEMPPLEYVIEPLLSVGGTGEIYAWRGTGKSFFTTELAVQIASGSPTLFGGPNAGGGNWPITKGYRTLYVYGEMHGSMIQERAQQIAKGHGLQVPTDEQLGMMCKDFQKSWRPKINSAKDRKHIEDRLFGHGYQGLVLDNISTLWPASQEGESDRSAILSEWFTDLNQRGIWIIYLHHAGKGGEQRGSSDKEDMLDFVLRLRRPPNYKHEQQLRVEVSIEKIRGECKQTRWLMPFEVSLVTDLGAAVWVTRPARQAQLEAAFEMFRNGMKPGDIWQEIGISRSTAFRYFKNYQENGDSKHWTDREE